MRVTFVIPYAGLQGGVRVIAIHAERLKRRGHEVFIVSGPVVTPLRRKLKSLLSGRGWPKPEPSHIDGLDVEHRVLETYRSVTDADVPDADVVVATFFPTAPGVLRLSAAKGAKAIFIQNYEVEEGGHIPALDASWRMPMHKITISKWLVALARDKFGDSIVSHVPNSADPDQFHSPPRKKGKVPTVGLLYHTNPFKGLETSLKALKRVATAVPSLHVVSFGAEFPSFALPLPSYATFHHRPAQDALRSLYAQCDVWMCGSNVEGFHLPPLEAMACRCPVVSTRVGGPLDIIDEGLNGHLVAVKDADALADRVLSVLNLPEEQWQHMSDAAFRTASSFSWEQATELFEQALELAIARNRRGEIR